MSPKAELCRPPWNTNIVQWTINVTSPIKMFGVTPEPMDWSRSAIHPLLLSPAVKRRVLSQLLSTLVKFINHREDPVWGLRSVFGSKEGLINNGQGQVRWKSSEGQNLTSVLTRRAWHWWTHNLSAVRLRRGIANLSVIVEEGVIFVKISCYREWLL